MKKKILAVGLALVMVGGVYFYNQVTIKSKINPTTVVVAAMDIPGHTKLTEDMLEEKVVPKDGIPEKAILAKKEDFIGKWTLDGYSVAEGSYLFKSKVLEKEKMPDSAILNLEEGEVAFPLLVDIETSSGNSIVPGTFVDLYLLASEKLENEDDERVLFGGLFQKVRVTAAKDQNTQDAFENDDENEENQGTKITRLYTLAVTPEQLQYLSRAKKLGTVLPVATGTSTKKEAALSNFAEVSDQEKIFDFIERKSVHPIPMEVKSVIAQNGILMEQTTKKAESTEG